MSVERLISRWQQQALIDETTAAALRADLKKSGSGFGLGSVLATLGGLLLGAAIIMLVAANWEELPRLLRVVFIFAVIWISYIAGAWRQAKGDRVFPATLYLIGAAAFGAGIALVGQMYHLSGDTASAALLWAGGVFASAFLLRSSALAAAAMAISGFYLSSFMWNGPSDYGSGPSYFIVGPLLAVIGCAAAIFTRSRPAGHLLAWFVIGWSLLVYANVDDIRILWVIAGLGVALLVLDGFAHDVLQRLTRFAEPIAAYGLLAAVIALSILQVNHALLQLDWMKRDVFYSVLILGLSIGALTLCGRDNNGLRWIVYATFSVEVLYLAFVTVGTMIGTSGFFLTAGILVLLLAAFVTRMERRMKRGRSVVAEVEP